MHSPEDAGATVRQSSISVDVQASSTEPPATGGDQSKAAHGRQLFSDFSQKYPYRPYPDIRVPSAADQPDMSISSEERYKIAVNILKELEQDHLEVNFPDAATPEYAAVMSRMDPTKMTPREKETFPSILSSDEAALESFLAIRNGILQIWHKNPKDEVTGAIVYEQLVRNPKTLPLKEYWLRVFQLLNRICAINYGVYKRDADTEAFISDRKTRLNKSIVVVGAGVAGLAAARKLEEWGFTVGVLEGRRRMGGRISTWRNEKAQGESKHCLAEQGAMIITGLEGNPVYTILHQQLGVSLERIGGRCPLFNHQGTPIPKTKDEILEVEFNTLLAAASKAGRAVRPGSNPSPPSLGEALRFQLKKEELDCLRRYRESKENQLDMIKVMTMHFKERKLVQVKLEDTKKQYKIAADAVELSRTNDTIWAFRLADAKMLEAADRLKELTEKMHMLQKKLEELVKIRPPADYLDEEERAVIGWHEANLEFANANHLDCLSLQQWDQDDEYELPGGHFSVPEGIDKLTTALASGIPHIAQGLNQSVYHIYDFEALGGPSPADRTDLKRAVHVLSYVDCEKKSIDCDAVICTTSLGILKQSLAKSDKEGSLRGLIHFSPPLPAEKHAAILSMGYGTLNKVLLTYKTRFWQAKRALFGFVNQEIQRRGEFFLFWSLYDQPVLVVLIAGEAAIALQEHSNEDIVKACQNNLRKIFGDGIEEPVGSVVTRWGSDVWSYGSYSSVGPAASGSSYDHLAAPLPDVENPRVLFAGEHTIRNYPATVHGALLSGLREATRIADTFLNLDGNLKFPPSDGVNLPQLVRIS